MERIESSTMLSNNKNNDNNNNNHDVVYKLHYWVSGAHNSPSSLSSFGRLDLTIVYNSLPSCVTVSVCVLAIENFSLGEV